MATAFRRPEEVCPSRRTHDLFRHPVVLYRASLSANSWTSASRSAFRECEYPFGRHAEAQKEPRARGVQARGQQGAEQGRRRPWTCCRLASAGPMWRKSHSERWGRRVAALTGNKLVRSCFPFAIYRHAGLVRPSTWFGLHAAQMLSRQEADQADPAQFHRHHQWAIVIEGGRRAVRIEKFSHRIAPFHEVCNQRISNPAAAPDRISSRPSKLFDARVRGE